MKVYGTIAALIVALATLAFPSVGFAGERTYVIPVIESPDANGSLPALYQPTEILFAEDGTLYLTGIHWRGWNTGRAVGYGTGHEKNCIPSCAQSRYRLIPNMAVIANRRTAVDDDYVYEGLWVHAGGAANRLNWAVTPSSIS